MLCRHIALGDSPQAGQPRLRGQQIVKTGVKCAVRHPVTDVQQALARVVQKTELRLGRQLAATRGKGLQPGRYGSFYVGLRIVQQCVTRACQGEQMATQIAAVHRGNVSGLQYLQRTRVVPVEEVPSVALQRVERVQGGFTARQQLCSVDPAERTRARYRQQIQTHVGGRGPFGHHGARNGLHIVRGQVVRRLADMDLKKSPSVARNSRQVGLLLRCGLRFFLEAPGPAEQPDPERRRSPSGAEQRTKDRPSRVLLPQRQPEQGSRQCDRGMRGDESGQTRQSSCLRTGGGGPLQ